MTLPFFLESWLLLSTALVNFHFYACVSSVAHTCMAIDSKQPPAQKVAGDHNETKATRVVPGLYSLCISFQIWKNESMPCQTCVESKAPRPKSALTDQVPASTPSASETSVVGYQPAIGALTIVLPMRTRTFHQSAVAIGTTLAYAPTVGRTRPKCTANGLVHHDCMAPDKLSAAVVVESQRSFVSHTGIRIASPVHAPSCQYCAK